MNVFAKRCKILFGSCFPPNMWWGIYLKHPTFLLRFCSTLKHFISSHNQSSLKSWRFGAPRYRGEVTIYANDECYIMVDWVISLNPLLLYSYIIYASFCPSGWYSVPLLASGFAHVTCLANWFSADVSWAKGCIPALCHHNEKNIP